MYVFTLAGTLGTWAGIAVAEILWISEVGVKPSLIYYGAKVSYKEVAKVAAKHSIDSNNPEKVTENIFNCLQFID